MREPCKGDRAFPFSIATPPQRCRRGGRNFALTRRDLFPPGHGLRPCPITRAKQVSEAGFPASETCFALFLLGWGGVREGPIRRQKKSLLVRGFPPQYLVLLC